MYNLKLIGAGIGLATLFLVGFGLVQHGRTLERADCNAEIAEYQNKKVVTKGLQDEIRNYDANGSTTTRRMHEHTF